MKHSLLSSPIINVTTATLFLVRTNLTALKDTTVHPYQILLRAVTMEQGAPVRGLHEEIGLPVDIVESLSTALINEDLVYRSRSEQDRRAISLMPTQDGYDFAAAVDSVLTRSVKDLWAFDNGETLLNFIEAFEGIAPRYIPLPIMATGVTYRFLIGLSRLFREYIAISRRERLNTAQLGILLRLHEDGAALSLSSPLLAEICCAPPLATAAILEDLVDKNLVLLSYGGTSNELSLSDQGFEMIELVKKRATFFEHYKYNEPYAQVRRNQEKPLRWEKSLEAAPNGSDEQKASGVLPEALYRVCTLAIDRSRSIRTCS